MRNQENNILAQFLMLALIVGTIILLILYTE